ncbi:archaeal proteasome endopeptidase complex subunit beta [Ignisphaera sp. 4213-co]|uniref:Proteasome subunit beta n=1 Tax=Ignisphaera cupida TaxID=3050454 RepID=A0ABD4Z8P7_9CREN|nr:archaeal proteasome endopeptidase complex subunit beta [Ignisphaera sp. 4213-co]MDK6029089.1 archaeal proteasome endopeptidase complex subunit beta [Ignisphaera sp. 4213-co]
MSYERLVTGATAVGIRVDSGVVLGAERRISYGGYIVSRAGRKVFKIGNRMAMAAAGLVGDMQTLHRILNAEIMYRELVTSLKVSVRAAAKLLSAILYSYKLMPFISEIIFGGYDEEGYHLYVLDPVGSVIEDDYAAVGTGAPIAIGIIEAEYRKDLSLENAADLAIRAIKAAISRDAVSGDGIDIITISKDGINEKSVLL